MQGKNGEIRYDTIAFDKFTISYFKKNLMPGHQCREKCAVCKKHWKATKTTHVHMAMDAGNKTNFFCTDCLVAGQTEMHDTLTSHAGLQMKLADFLVLRPGGTYYAFTPEGLHTIILAVDITSNSALVAGPVEKGNIWPLSNYVEFTFRELADSEERKFIAAHFNGY